MSAQPQSWYIRGESGQPTGPYTADQLIESWRAGRVDANTICWCEGMLDWLALAQVEPFASAMRSVTPPPPPASESGSPPVRRRRISGVWIGWGIVGAVVAVGLTVAIVAFLLTRGGDGDGVPGAPSGLSLFTPPRKPRPHGADDAVDGLVSRTDLSATLRRARELFKEWQDELNRAQKKTQGNEIAAKKEISRINEENVRKITDELSTLQGQSVQWRFTVSEILEDFILFREAPNTGYAWPNDQSNPMFIWFSDGSSEQFAHAPGYLKIKGNISRSHAEKLRRGDSLLIRGRLTVRVVPEIGNSFLRIAIQLNNIQVATNEFGGGDSSATTLAGSRGGGPAEGRARSTKIAETQPESDFLGEWTNRDFQTLGITRIRIRRANPGSGRIVVRLWTKSSQPTGEMDHGDGNAVLGNKVLSVNQTSLIDVDKMEMTLLENGDMQVDAHPRFSGRESVDHISGKSVFGKGLVHDWSR